jgi:hypothetical protein
MRDRLARLKRKSKAYSKFLPMLSISINLWANKDKILKNIEKYCSYNQYINNLAPIKHLRTQENNGVYEEVA